MVFRDLNFLRPQPICVFLHPHRTRGRFCIDDNTFKMDGRPVASFPNFKLIEAGVHDVYAVFIPKADSMFDEEFVRLQKEHDMQSAFDMTASAKEEILDMCVWPTFLRTAHTRPEVNHICMSKEVLMQRSAVRIPLLLCDEFVSHVCAGFEHGQSVHSSICAFYDVVFYIHTHGTKELVSISTVPTILDSLFQGVRIDAITKLSISMATTVTAQIAGSPPLSVFLSTFCAENKEHMPGFTRYYGAGFRIFSNVSTSTRCEVVCPWILENLSPQLSEIPANVCSKSKVNNRTTGSKLFICGLQRGTTFTN
jgi:hypothetical protein